MKDEYSYNYECFTHDYYEYEQGQKAITVRADEKILMPVILFCLLSLSIEFPLFLLHQNALLKMTSSLYKSDFLSEAIKDLLDCALIKNFSNILYVVNPLTISV